MSEGGELLVAAPSLVDPNFARSVVLIVHRDPEGAVGVVLNRPTTAALGDVLPNWAQAAALPAVVFIGGPVQQEVAVAIVEGGWDLPGWRPVVGETGLADLDPEQAPDVDRLRVYSGYAGWGPGQLEAELETDDWLIVPARPDDPFTADPDHLWSAVLKRQPGMASLLSTYPADPSVN